MYEYELLSIRVPKFIEEFNKNHDRIIIDSFRELFKNILNVNEGFINKFMDKNIRTINLIKSSELTYLNIGAEL